MVLLKTYHEMLKSKRLKQAFWLETLLKLRPMRSLSGIVNVAVLTKPYPCPGKCIYCPSQKEAPKSYLTNEPAVMRAVLNKYDPARQVETRIIALENTGHPTDKIELRIIGGTWSFYPEKYKKWFVKRCFDACNGKFGKTLEFSQKINEEAKHRIIGLSIETRPDFINIEEIKKLRKLGVTMTELGVQSVFDDVLKLNKRGHAVKETIKATKLLKNAGFKVLYQMMPNLPGSSLKKDEKMFEETFENPNFKPDLMKIYPCAVLKEAKLYRWWKEKKYKPYKDEELINLVKTIKKKVPYFVRIQRITRDIPSQSVVAGPAKISNLRQVIEQDSRKESWRCKCIRCREIKGNYDATEKIILYRLDYEASGGKEIFLSFENKNRDKLYSLLRLRIPAISETPSFAKASEDRSACEHSYDSSFPILQNSALIREMHTYGQLNPLESSSFSKISPQHKGLGKKLIFEAEKIAKKEFGFKRITVIAGIGARNYFKKFGYRLKETYMTKQLK